MAEIKYVIGDATRPEGGIESKIIVHCCNNVGVWGKGFVMAVSRRWPHVRDAYLSLPVDENRKIELGLVQMVEASNHKDLLQIFVANLIGQDGIATRENPSPVRYDAIAKGLTWIADQIPAPDLFSYTERYTRPTVHMPRIGCGLAGGTWDRIEPIIKNTLVVRGIDVTVYDLPEFNFS